MRRAADMNQTPGDGSGPNGHSQRWRRRRSSWVAPARGVVDTGRYDIDRVETAAAKRFVVEHHYSASFPASRFTYGLTDRHDGELVGVAVFGIPSSARVLTNAFPDLAPYDESLELSRLVLLDGVAYNAESWFVAACQHDLVSRGVAAWSPSPTRSPATPSTGASSSPVMRGSSIRHSTCAWPAARHRRR
jgi:hypothetical protein